VVNALIEEHGIGQAVKQSNLLGADHTLHALSRRQRTLCCVSMTPSSPGGILSQLLWILTFSGRTCTSIRLSLFDPSSPRASQLYRGSPSAAPASLGALLTARLSGPCRQQDVRGRDCVTGAMDHTPRGVRHCAALPWLSGHSSADVQHLIRATLSKNGESRFTCRRVAALLYVLRCLPALFAPSGLIGITLVFLAGGAATLLLLVTTVVRSRCLLTVSLAAMLQRQLVDRKCPVKRLCRRL